MRIYYLYGLAVTNAHQIFFDDVEIKEMKTFKEAYLKIQKQSKRSKTNNPKILNRFIL